MLNSVTGPIAGFLAACALFTSLSTTTRTDPGSNDMRLGAFSVSLAVKDLEASRAFYAKLGFEQVGGEAKQNWLILRNGTTTIGLFHGMFEQNIMTFNPGWSPLAEGIDDFEDVRSLQAKLEASGVELTTKADPTTTGPASLVLSDPDGNTILLDQHVPSPSSWSPSEG